MTALIGADTSAAMSLMPSVYPALEACALGSLGKFDFMTSLALARVGTSQTLQKITVAAVIANNATSACDDRSPD